MPDVITKNIYDVLKKKKGGDFAEIYLIFFCKQRISFLIKGRDEEFSLLSYQPLETQHKVRLDKPRKVMATEPK